MPHGRLKELCIAVVLFGFVMNGYSFSNYEAASIDMAPWEMQWSQTFPAGHAQFSQPIGDADNDGFNELLVGGYRDAHLSVLQWEPELATYVTEAAWNEADGYAGGGAIGELTGDGDNEVAVVWNHCKPGGNGTYVYHYEDDGYQILDVIQLDDFEVYYDCAIYDYDDDGYNDLFVFGWVKEGPELCIFTWDEADGSFVLSASWDDERTGYYSFIPTVAADDVDGDGATEVICLPGRYAMVLNRNNDEFFSTEVYKCLGINELTYGVATGDLNGNGRAEIALGLGSQVHNVPSMVVLEYDAHTDEYHEVWNQTWDGEKDVAEAMHIGDADNDGQMEIVVATNVVHIISWNGITYVEEAIIDETYGFLPAANIGDCDSDGYNEIKPCSLRQFDDRPQREWVFQCPIIDETPPVVHIDQPIGHLYLQGQPVAPLPFGLTLVVGPVEADVEAADEDTGIQRVEFYLDDRLQATDEIPPYSWTINEQMQGRHRLTVIAYNGMGNVAIQDIDMWIFIG